MVGQQIKLASQALYLVAILAILVMMLHICADVVLRSFFSSPIVGTLEITTFYYMPIVATLPVAIAQLRNEHIEVEVFTQGLSARASAWLFLFNCLIIIPYLAGLFYFSLLDAIKKTKIGEFIGLVGWDLQVWPSRWTISVAYFLFLLCIFYLVYRVIQFLRERPEGRPPNEHEHVDFYI